MKVRDAGELIFTSKEGEDGVMAMECDNTLFGINFAFKPAVPHKFTEDNDRGLMREVRGNFGLTIDFDSILARFRSFANYFPLH